MECVWSGVTDRLEVAQQEIRYAIGKREGEEKEKKTTHKEGERERERGKWIACCKLLI